MSSRLSARLLLVPLAMSGCECTRPLTLALGEVRWEWETAEGPQSGETALIDFGTRPMGSTTNQTVFVRNIGRASFLLSEFAKVVGDPVRLNGRGELDAPFALEWDQDRQVAPSERQPLLVTFSPRAPADVTGKAFDANSVLDFLPEGAPAAQLELKGRAISGECEVPGALDFGTVPVGTMVSEVLDLRNEASIPVTVTVSEVMGPGAVGFSVTGFDGRGGREVLPGELAMSRVTFTPTETREYEARLMVRRTASCPAREVRLTGRGVSTCLSFRSMPTDDARLNSLFLGYVAPGQAGDGTVTFLNACSTPVTLSGLATGDAVFLVTEAAPGDVTRQFVPAATRTPSGWVEGSADVKLQFRPTALGQRTSTLRAATTLSAQPMVTVRLRGVGGGPRLEVRPSPLSVGRIGFTPGASPPLYVPRTLRVANTGTLPMPADPRGNLKLGRGGGGPPYWRVTALMGSESELCVGEWDLSRNGCTGTLQPNRYDPNTGIEATAAAALQVPVRIIPQSAGPKAWEVTFFSNDALSPETVVRITAEAVEAPPCNFEVLPGQLNFGVIDQPQVRDLQFTLRNRGVQPDQVCYFNAIELTPASDDTFSIPIPLPALTVGPGQQVPVTVRAQPLRPAPLTPAVVRGEVTFGVSNPAMPTGSVQLQATLAPSCISIAPSPLDFMNTELECGSPGRTVSITNTCATPLTLVSATLTNAALVPPGTGSCTAAPGCPQFAVAVAATPGVINPGASRTLQLRHRPFVLGPTTGELTVTVQQGGQPVTYPVVLTGTGVPRSMMGCGVTAICPAPITTGANSQVPLTPSVMAPGPVSCSWTVGSRPPTSNGTFSAPSSCTFTNYFADVVGTHVVTFTVNDGLGSTSTCSTPITVTPNGDLWVELTWDRNNDMDLHLLHQNGGSPLTASSWSNNLWDCYFAQRTPVWGTPQQSPSLDRDDITGRGPENTRINSPAVNVAYTVGVHMYSWAASPTPVLSTVRVYCGGQLVATQQRSMNRLKDMWVVGSVQFSGGMSCSFNLIDTIVPNAPP